MAMVCLTSHVKRGKRLTNSTVGASISTAGAGCYSLTIRVTEKMMIEARWVIGDRVDLFYNGDYERFVLKRNPAGTGLKLSPAIYTKKGETGRLLGKPADATCCMTIRKDHPFVRERQPLVECLNVELCDDGIYFNFPDAFLLGEEK